MRHKDNARLIAAAAPEMYRVLVEFEVALRNRLTVGKSDPLWPVYEKVRALLTKMGWAL